jgi:hypothetical protein
VTDNSVDLRPDAVVARLAPVSDTTPDAVPLVGLLGEGSTGRSRLYQDVTFQRWLEIENGDIEGRVSADGGDDVTAGQSVIRVRRDARLVLCESVRASTFEASPGLGDGPDLPVLLRQWPFP